ncbi:hypothetical protein HDU96_005532 [Phlyctochytrium bullatum]|nr:hypothetical protein HDU96_005532 [Phlyctochytrium bullatum]
MPPPQEDTSGRKPSKPHIALPTFTLSKNAFGSILDRAAYGGSSHPSNLRSLMRPFTRPRLMVLLMVLGVLIYVNLSFSSPAILDDHNTAPAVPPDADPRAQKFNPHGNPPTTASVPDRKRPKSPAGGNKSPSSWLKWSQSLISSDPQPQVSTHDNLGEPLFDSPRSRFDKAVAEQRKKLHPGGPSPATPPSKYDRFAVALKTGTDVALERASIQLVTFLQKIKKLVLIGESAGVHVGEHAVVDVYSGLYDLVDRRIQAQEARNGKSGASPPKKVHGLPVDAPQSKPPANATDPHPPSHRHRRRAVNKDAVVPAENSQGWKLDAHKNLPGFEYLYSTHPDADWYVMIDDDTYVFFDNLIEYLRDRDPEVPFYTGSANVFVGCDDVEKFGDGPLFAHGGSGIVMSRGAMKKMGGIMEQCIKKYKDCWAGDVRVALCLRDAGVLITPGDFFEKEPPNDEYQFPKDPCTRPNTFHHLLPHQIQRLFEIETTSLSEHPKTLLTMSDVLRHFHPHKGSEPETNMDRPGNDFENRPSRSARICEGHCLATAGCVGWAFDGSTCWMKDGISVKAEVRGVVSGIVVEKYACT